MAFLLALLATQSAASTAPLPPGVDVLSEVTTGFNINSSNPSIQLDVGDLVSMVSGDIADTQTTYLQHVVLNLTAPAGVDKIPAFNLTLYTDDTVGQPMTVDPTNDTVLIVAVGSEYAPGADMYFQVSAPVWTDPSPVFSYSMRVSHATCQSLALPASALSCRRMQLTKLPRRSSRCPQARPALSQWGAS